MVLTASQAECYIFVLVCYIVKVEPHVSVTDGHNFYSLFCI